MIYYVNRFLNVDGVINKEKDELLKLKNCSSIEPNSHKFRSSVLSNIKISNKHMKSTDSLNFCRANLPFLININFQKLHN